jgi:3-methyladenine DNA glycosylase AlkC
VADGDAPLLKDFVDEALVASLAERFAAAAPGFDAAAFRSAVVPALAGLELKDRIAHIARELAAQLPPDFAEAVAIVVAAATRHPPASGWAAWPLATFIELFGGDHPGASLDAMETITTLSSCEFAIRVQLERHPDETWARLAEWVRHHDEAVRRLVSEGTRPLLPWGRRVAALRADPRPGLALVERLRADPSETVRRSVANHLNDVSKDHPDLAVETAGRWARDGSPEVDAVVRHGLRTLVKRGHLGALEVLGFTTEPSIVVDSFGCDPTEMPIGGRVELSAAIRSTASEPQRIVVDLVVHYVKADGSTSPKVFKWKVLDLDPGEEQRMTRRHWFRDQSTRTHRPGEHVVILQIAGRPAARTTCLLTG